LTIGELVSLIRTLPDCRVFPPCGLPNIEPRYQLPKDVWEFYRLCGGLVLFEHAQYSVQVVPPQEFVPANPVIVGERCEYDRSADWHIFAHHEGGDYLTIDLNPARLGLCYDSFHETHGLVGDCPVIGRSFTETLACLVENRGDYWYWLKDDHEPLGDAYDD
jgi:hypothetical protein